MVIAHRTRLVAIALCIAAVIASLLAPRDTIASTDGPMIGAQTHSTWGSVSIPKMRRELDLLRDTGANVVRADLNWSSLETTGKGSHSSWYIDRWDTFLDEADSRGLAVIATVFGTPCWASSAPTNLKQGCTGEWWGRGVTEYPPSNPGDFGAAIGWVSERWGHRLAALEIWNEPNEVYSPFMQDRAPEETYTAMLRSAYAEAKKASDVTVLAGALSFSDADFLREMYRHGAKGHFDALAIHPYNEWRDPDDLWRPEYQKHTFRTGVPGMHDVMVNHGDGAKQLWLTEFGWSHCTDGDRWCVSRSQQATYIGDAIRILRGWDFVAAATVYEMRDSATEIPRENRFGLIRRDFTPKRSYGVFQRAIAGVYPDASRPPLRLLSRRRVRLRDGRTAGLFAACRSEGATCSGVVRLKAQGARVGKRRISVPAQSRRAVRIRLNRAGLRLSRERNRLRVRARAYPSPTTAKRRAVRRFTLVPE